MRGKAIAAIGLFFTAACMPSAMRTIVIFGDTLPFVPDPSDNDMSIYRNPRRKATSYSEFLIDPVTLYGDQYAGNRGINPEQKKLLADEFRQELIDVLKDRYEIVDAPGPEVMRIRAAIRDIHPAHFQLDENKFVVLKFDTKLESAELQFDCLDSLTGERVVSLVRTLKGPRYMTQENLERINNIQDAFRAWTKSLRKRFDEARAGPESN